MGRSLVGKMSRPKDDRLPEIDESMSRRTVVGGFIGRPKDDHIPVNIGSTSRAFDG